MHRFDQWVGLKVFQPPIIRVCRWLGYTQHRLHREMWFAVFLWVAWELASSGTSWPLMTLQLVLAAFMGLRAALAPDTEQEQSWLWFRLFLWALVLLGVCSALLVSGKVEPIFRTLWTLAAEYAATIKTIPPRERKAHQRRKAPA